MLAKSNIKNEIQENSAGKQLVIVESPAKSRTISKYLGPDYIVMASMGHIRDLAEKNPKGVKNPVPGVDLENNFNPSYEIIKEKGKFVTQLKKLAKNAVHVWLATDLDREGEAIAWHLKEALNLKDDKVWRVVFNAITKSEIEKAFKHPRHIDRNKVNAQQARRILDKIVGYLASPLLWKKVAAGLSAGRVQSVAVRLLVEREREIEAFIPDEFWKITGLFSTDIIHTDNLQKQWEKWVNGKNISKESNDNGDHTQKEKNTWLLAHESFTAELVKVKDNKIEFKNLDDALKLACAAGFVLDKVNKYPPPKGSPSSSLKLEGHFLSSSVKWNISSIQTKRITARPNAPFITSTLQQAASIYLSFTAQTTMRTAQDLYEGINIAGMGSVGLITYMRTDSTNVSSEALDLVRHYINKTYGPDYLPLKPNYFASSNKSAQEAHEAIRPTDVSLVPEKIRSSLDNKQYALYKLIWERFISSQMSDAKWDSTSAFIDGETKEGLLTFKTSGRVLSFDGHYKLTGLPNTGEEATLPKLEQNQAVCLFGLEPKQSFSAPPPRYNEASLIKKLEAVGIGRPSTYAQIIQVIQSRKYAEKTQNKFYATDLGIMVTDKLIEALPEVLEINYTRDMEQQLDDIEDKDLNWKNMLSNFYGLFKSRLDAAYDGITHAKAEIVPAPYKCPECGSDTVYRFGRNGRFLSCSSYPECKYASPIDKEGKLSKPVITDLTCINCGGPTVLRKGRFGPFISCVDYPKCSGIINIDRKGGVVLPKISPLITEIKCTKCQNQLNLRRGAKGPWLSCSKFPKCKGRMSWVSLDDEVKKKLEHALELHEKNNPTSILKTVNGDIVENAYIPKTKTD